MRGYSRVRVGGRTCVLGGVLSRCVCVCVVCVCVCVESVCACVCVCVSWVECVARVDWVRRYVVFFAV